jgi:hypothetical protein
MIRPLNYLLIASVLVLSITACKKDKSPTPFIISLLPTAAFQGDTVTLLIKDFPQDLSQITFTINNTPAAAVMVTEDSIQLIVPQKSGSGPVAAVINGQTYTGPDFTYKRTAIVTTIAGTGYAGFKDAQGTAAAFNSPWGISTDNKGYLFVADAFNNSIRKISLETGNVSSFRILITNGKNFYTPYGIAVDPVTHDIYATDYNSHVMRMDSSGNASVIFEIADSGPLAGIALSPDRKNLYICNTNAGTIIKTGVDGSNPQTFSSGILTPRAIVFDQNGKMYVGAYPYAIYRVSADGKTTPFVNAPDFKGWEFVRDSAGHFYLADYFANKILMTDPGGTFLNVIAGSGKPADIDGKGLKASFNGPRGLTIDKEGNLYISTYNFDTHEGNKIRKISFQ